MFSRKMVPAVGDITKTPPFQTKLKPQARDHSKSFLISSKVSSPGLGAHQANRFLCEPPFRGLCYFIVIAPPQEINSSKQGKASHRHANKRDFSYGRYWRKKKKTIIDFATAPKSLSSSRISATQHRPGGFASHGWPDPNIQRLLALQSFVEM